MELDAPKRLTVVCMSAARAASSRVLEGHSDAVFSVAYHLDGRRALSGADDNTVRLWDLESGSQVRVLEGHSGRVWSVAWSPDGRRALSSADDKTVRLWDARSGAPLGAPSAASLPSDSVTGAWHSAALSAQQSLITRTRDDPFF